VARKVLLASLAIAVCASGAVAGGYASEQEDTWCSKNNTAVVWCGRGRDRLSFEELATAAAPTLWFSPDEPLMGVGNVHLPEVIRCLGSPSARSDQQSLASTAAGPREESTVYYRIARVELHGKGCDLDLLDAQTLPLGCVRKVAIRYYFYYELDVGVHSHWNDLERVELILGFDHHPSEEGLPPKDRRVFKATLLYAKGYAHEGEWQTNILHVKDPPYPVLPLTILVEEGKHASCPDRNADGLYTPGYDVNARTNDAWGVRDVFASKLPGARYRQEQFKPRRSSEEDPTGPAHRIGGPASGLPHRYALVSAHDRTPCDVPMPEGEEAAQHPLSGLLRLAKPYRLDHLMTKHGFGEPPEIYTSRLRFHYGRLGGLATVKNFAVGVSFLERKLPWGVLTFNLPWEVPLAGGWAFLRAEATSDHPRDTALGLGYTPSVGRFADWYAVVGLRRRNDVTGPASWRCEAEGGLQARVWNVGVRLGVVTRISDYRLTDHRVTAQVMLGPWPGGTARGRD
jgi:hypothetical protein